MFVQSQIRLPAMSRGWHLITHQVRDELSSMAKTDAGLLHVFLLHTSASLSLNENADPDVRDDLELALNRIAPENAGYQHTVEGPDDMPAHVKSSLLGASLLLPVASGNLLLGTWQGIYLCEHRDRAGPRTLVLTLWSNSSNAG